MTTPVSHVAHPAQVNQFFRIVNGKKGTRWNDIHTVAGKPHNFDAENCMAAEGAVAASAHRDLASVYSPNRIRGAQTDFLGGIGVDDVDVAFHELGIGELAHPANFDWTDTIQAVIDRRHAAVAVDYRKMPTGEKLQLPGSFDHALGLDDFDQRLGLILVYDSLGLEPHWRPEAGVRAAAEALALRERGKKGALYVGVTRQRLPLPTGIWKATVRREPGEVLHRFGRYFVSGSVVVDTQSPTPRTAGFSASCTAPALYRWPGHPAQRLVRLTSGSRKGWYIRSGYAERIA